MITLPIAALPCAMMISGILIAHVVGNKKNIILDFFAALIVLLIVVCIIIQFHLF